MMVANAPLPPVATRPSRPDPGPGRWRSAGGETHRNLRPTVERQGYDRSTDLVHKPRVPKHPTRQVRRAEQQVEVLAHLEYIHQRVERRCALHLVVGRPIGWERLALLGHVTPKPAP